MYIQPLSLVQMLFRQLKYVCGLQPNEDSMFQAIDWAVPGLGGETGGPDEDEEEALAPGSALVLREATLGWPTRLSVWDAVLIAINCARCFSSVAMAWLFGTAMAAATAPAVLSVERKPTTYVTAPITATTAAMTAVNGTTTPGLREARRFPGARLRCSDNEVLSDGHPRVG